MVTTDDISELQRAAVHRGHRVPCPSLGLLLGGAAQQELSLQAIERAGFTIVQQRLNGAEFICDQARNASAAYGVKTLSALARKD